MAVGFSNIAQYVAADEAGRTHFCSFRKVPSQATVAGWWADLSMASGNPPPNYYAATPATAKVLDGYDGIFHGAAKDPASMHLTKLGVMSSTAGFVGQFMLMDYLLYYSFVDCDSDTAQPMVNYPDAGAFALPRYADGAGVMVMAVAVAPTVGGGRFTFDYVNQDGVSRTSPEQVCSTTGANIASLATSQQAVAGMPGGPFLTLASGDTGVRSITSVTFTILNGGLIALVLVKPLTDLAIREINTMVEVGFVHQHAGAPRIYDGAYLNLIVNTPATIAAGLLAGYANFAWSA